jgi:hypothetical protein
MRGWGMNPAALGVHPVLDTIFDAWQVVDLLRCLAGCPDAGTAWSDRLPHALANLA